LDQAGEANLLTEIETILTEEVDLVEDLKTGAVEEDLGTETLENHLECMMLPAVNVEKTAKFHSSQQEASLFCVVVVLDRVVQTEIVEIQEEIQEILTDLHNINQEILQNNLIRLMQN